MRFRRPRTVAIAAMTAAALVVPTTAMAGRDAWYFPPAEPYDRGVPTFEFDVDVEADCDEARYAVYEPEGFGDPETEIERDDAGLQVTPGASNLSGTFAVPGLEGGQYLLVIECGPEEEASRYPGLFEFRRLVVDKVVEGEVPAGTTFTVQADCTPSEGSDFEFGPISVELDYGADGGTESVILYDVSFDISCGIVETETPSPTPTPTDDGVVDDDVEEAAPATPVTAEPTYTG